MLKTFRIGGIHPPDNKWSASQAIITLPPPTQAVVMLSQHIGAPAEAIVQKGDKVKAGALIAKANGFISAAIHSPVSGTVSRIDNAVDASGTARPAIYINVEDDVWEESVDRTDAVVKYRPLTRTEIIERITGAGIVGLGGATFPTHVKLSPPPGNKAEVLIVNAVECEPYLTADHRMMYENSEEVFIGITILMEALKVSRAVIGIENNKRDAVRHMTFLARNFEGIEVVPLKVKYPQGGEKQLIDAIVRRQVASGALPISVGAVVQNVGTVFAVYEAVQKNKPLVDRVVTVTGKGVAKPSNFLVRIGTPIRDLIEAAGGTVGAVGKIIGGGPMMGKALVGVDVPVTKGTSGILVLPAEEAVRRPAQPCIRCAKCVAVCPMGLNPTLLMSAGEHARWDLAEEELITDCIECGSCSYTCPSRRPLLDYIRLGKGKVTAIIRARKS
jgi:electron transport complex protein RnfC